SYNLTHGQIPPRISPHMSFKMGYPVFTFYAPFAYWVSSALNLSGFDVADSLKLSFLIAIILGALGMYYFLRSFFGMVASIFGAALYACSPYVAVEIFVRGNLGEVWFLGLLPWTLYFYFHNSFRPSRTIF